MTVKLRGSSILMAGLLACSSLALAANTQMKTEIYAGSGDKLFGYSLAADGTLQQNSVTQLPAPLQFAVADKGNRHLYVASSNINGANPGDTHTLSAFTIDHATGQLHPLGAPVKLEQRPIHLTLDRDGTHALLAYNLTPTLTVHALERDGRIGAQVKQDQPIQPGVFTHQVTVTPNNAFVIAPGRGNDASAGRPEDLGTLSTFSYAAGKLTSAGVTTLAPSIGPRHVAYHPRLPLAYVAMERGSSIYTYPLTKEGRLAEQPLFKSNTLDPHWQAEADEGIKKGGVIQVRADGKYLYATNRSDELRPGASPAVFKHGENDVIVYALNSKTGEPTLLQHIATHGVEARTISVTPGNRWLVVGNQKSGQVTQGTATQAVKANIALFRIKPDGTLAFHRKYDMAEPDKSLMWVEALQL